MGKHVKLLGIFLCAAHCALAAGWYSPYQYRYPVTITSTNSVTQTDYQVLIALTSGNFNFATALSDGSDIRVTDSDGITLLPYTITAYSSGGQTGTIWVKVPSIPATSTYTLYLYSGNPAPSLFAIPPIGPWTKLGKIDTNAGRLPENIVWDSATSLYWLVWSPNGSIYLSYSSDLVTWTPYASNPVINDGGQSPCLIQSGGTWYMFYQLFSPPNTSIVLKTATSVTGPYSASPTTMLIPGVSTWDAQRVLEPYVVPRGDGTWIMLYMGGNPPSVLEQVGYATAPAIGGPYTKYASNPVIALGSNTYDTNTVSDPYAYLVGSTWYIGYAAGTNTSLPWQQAFVTTRDWVTFKKGNVFLGTGDLNAVDAGDAHRGAWFQAGSLYYLPYACTSPVGNATFYMCEATAPAFSSAAGFPPDQVFGFYDAFPTWPEYHLRRNFQGGSDAVSGGILTITSGSGFANGQNLYSAQEFGYGWIYEALVKRTANGNLAGELGFGSQTAALGTWTARIYDLNNAKWQLDTAFSGDTTTSSTTSIDTNWHTQSVWRISSSSIKFKVDAAAPWEGHTTNIPINTLPVFMLSYAASGANNFQVNWARVRQYSEPEPTVGVGGVQTLGSIPAPVIW